MDPPLFPESELDVYGGLDKLERKGNISRILGLSSSQNLFVLDILSVIARITDGSRFFEFKQKFGENLTCGFAHINQMVRKSFLFRKH